ncbi:MAG: Cpe/LpqF family protein [Microbacterium arborescens]
MPRSTQHRTFRRPVAVVLAALAASVLAACSAGAAAPETSSSPVTIPDTSVGSQARWVLDEINADEPTSTTDLEARVAPVVLEELTTTGLQDVVTQLQAAAPWTVTGYEGDDTRARVTIESSQVTYDMTISIDADELINGLFFGPPQPDRTPAASWDELRTQVEQAPFEASLRVTGADGTVLESAGSSEAGPIGSIFKLWVLGAVVDAIDAGGLAWDDELTIDGRVRSIPSGELQDLPDGSTVTVREAADKMIAISDNTATDALIQAVGRGAVEAAMSAMGHSDPASNIPFLTTREMAWFLFGDDDLRALWANAAGDGEARRALLERVPSGVPDLARFPGAAPGWSEGIDWFATHDDLVAAHLALQQRAATEAGAPVRDILSANPGIEFDDAWTYVGFKGGSSIGVLAGSWYLEREGLEPVVLTILARADDAQSLANPAVAFGWAQDAAALLTAP